MIRSRNNTRKTSLLFAFAAMPARKKLVGLTAFLLISAVAINTLFDMAPEDEVYNAKHLNRAKNRPKIDLNLELKEEITKIEPPKTGGKKKQKIDAKPKQNDTTKQNDAKQNDKTNTTDAEEEEDAYQYEYMYDDVVDLDDIITDSEALLRAYGIEEKLESISDGDALHDWTAPQGRAFQWIVNEDERMVNVDDPHLIQRYVLAVLYFATGGEKWHNGNLHWLSGVHECFWNKKVKGRSMGVVDCDDDKNVTYIELVENNLQGILPKEIGWLENLISLDLQENRLFSYIPTTLGNIHSLRNLFINSNSFIGTIPSQLGQLSNLTLLLLDTNELTGKMPDEVCTLKNHSHLYSLWADCAGTPAPPIECNCCSMCCDGLGYCTSPQDSYLDMDDEFYFDDIL